MRKLTPDQEVARRVLSNGYSLAAYAVPGEDRAQFRVLHERDQSLTLSVSAEDAVALCAMAQPPP